MYQGLDDREAPQDTLPEEIRQWIEEKLSKLPQHLYSHTERVKYKEGMEDAYNDMHVIEVSDKKRIAALTSQLAQAIKERPKYEPKDRYFIGECGKCGFKGCSNEWGGCGQIADTRDYSDPVCPICGSPDLEDADDKEYVDQRKLFLDTINKLNEQISNSEVDKYELSELKKEIQSLREAKGMRWVNGAERLPDPSKNEIEYVIKHIETGRYFVSYYNGRGASVLDNFPGQYYWLDENLSA